MSGVLSGGSPDSQRLHSSTVIGLRAILMRSSRPTASRCVSIESPLLQGLALATSIPTPRRLTPPGASGSFDGPTRLPRSSPHIAPVR